MTDDPMTPIQAADMLFANIPHAIGSDALEEYGLEGGRSQSRQITREVLFLSLFWIGCALRVSLPARATQRILEELHQCIRRHWRDELHLDQGDPGEIDRFFQELEARRATYEALMQEGADPLALAGETAAQLDLMGAVPSTDRTKALALVFDLVPIDDIGAVIETIDSIVE